MLRDYYQILRSTLDEHNFHDRPMDIYNCDETIVDLNKATKKVIVPEHYSKAHSRSVSGIEHISILCCANADGSAIPPMIIFKNCHPGGKYGDGGPDGALYSFSPSGFMDGDLFKRWLVKLFIPHTHPTPERPVLLILDGHASHSTIDMIEAAMANNVILLAMAPHTTHMCQPLDVAVFRSFKAELGKIVKDCQLIRSDLWVSKSGVPRMLKAPFDNSMSRTNIKNGFRKCGIFPYDPNAIDKTQIKNVVGDVDLSIPHPAEEEVQETPSEQQDDAPALQVMDDLLDESSGDENHLHSNDNVTQVSRVIKICINTGSSAKLPMTSITNHNEITSITGNTCQDTCVKTIHIDSSILNQQIDELELTLPEIDVCIESSDNPSSNLFDESITAMCSPGSCFPPLDAAQNNLEVASSNFATDIPTTFQSILSTFDINQPSTSGLNRPSTSGLNRPSTSGLNRPSTPSLNRSSTPSLKQPSTSSASSQDLSASSPLQRKSSSDSAARLKFNKYVEYKIMSPSKYDDILFPIEPFIPNNRKRPLRVSNKARVLTNKDISDEIDDKIREIERKEQEKTERKRKRLESQEIMQARKTAKKTSKPRGKTRQEEAEDDDCYLCAGEFREYSSYAQKRWVGCETNNCPHWACPRCLPDNFDYENEYLCEDCNRENVQP